MANSMKTSNRASRQGYFYRAYAKFGCLFVFFVVGLTMIASISVCIYIFDLDKESSFLVTSVVMFVIGYVCHHFTSGVDDNRHDTKKSKSIIHHPYNDEPTLDYSQLCWKCGSSLIHRYDDGTCICQSCGFIFGV